MNDNKSPFRYKKVGKDKYEYDFLSYEEWEDLMNEENGIKKQSIKKILRDIVLNIKDSYDMRDDYYDYDRGDFIKSIIKRDGENVEEVYSTDIESITKHILQISKFGFIRYYDENGDDLRKNFRIKENKIRRVK